MVGDMGMTRRLHDCFDTQPGLNAGRLQHCEPRMGVCEPVELPLVTCVASHRGKRWPPVHFIYRMSYHVQPLRLHLLLSIETLSIQELERL